MTINTDFTKRYEKIPVEIFNEPDDAILQIAGSIAETINEKTKNNQHCTIGLSASISAITLYNTLSNMCKEGKLSFKRVHIFGVDEYWPISKKELQSHYRFLKEYLLDNIDISPRNIHLLNGETAKGAITQYCHDYEAKIESLGGLDLLVIGNMGYNEPGSHYNSRTRLITLNYNTRVSSASDFFGVEYVPFHALTIGIETILSAKRIYYLAWGEGKTGAIAKMVEGPVTDQVPGSYLQNHANIKVALGCS